MTSKIIFILHIHVNVNATQLARERGVKVNARTSDSDYNVVAYTTL